MSARNSPTPRSTFPANAKRRRHTGPPKPREGAILRNPKQEHFAQLVAEGINQTEAARRVGYSEHRATVTASEFCAKSEIAARITELRNQVTEVAVTTSGINKAWVIEGLARNVEEARAAQQYGAVNKSLELIGIELGVFVKKSEVKMDWPDDIALLDEEQLTLLDDYAARLTGKVLQVQGETTDVVPQEKEEKDGW